MKLRKFMAKDVYGYLKFNIDFHLDLSFLIVQMAAARPRCCE